MAAEGEREGRGGDGRGERQWEETAEHIRHICLPCLVTLQCGDAGAHFLQLMCLPLQLVPSVNTRLLDSRFSFRASRRIRPAPHALSYHSFFHVLSFLHGQEGCF